MENQNKKYQTRICFGAYETEDDAAHACDFFMISLFGDAAKLNFEDCDYSSYVPKIVSKRKKKFVITATKGDTKLVFDSYFKCSMFFKKDSGLIQRVIKNKKDINGWCIYCDIIDESDTAKLLAEQYIDSAKGKL